MAIRLRENFALKFAAMPPPSIVGWHMACEERAGNKNTKVRREAALDIAQAHVSYPEIYGHFGLSLSALKTLIVKDEHVARGVIGSMDAKLASKLIDELLVAAYEFPALIVPAAKKAASLMVAETAVCDLKNAAVLLSTTVPDIETRTRGEVVRPLEMLREERRGLLVEALTDSLIDMGTRAFNREGIGGNLHAAASTIRSLAQSSAKLGIEEVAEIISGMASNNFELPPFLRAQLRGIAMGLGVNTIFNADDTKTAYA